MTARTPGNGAGTKMQRRIVLVSLLKILGSDPSPGTLTWRPLTGVEVSYTIPAMQGPPPPEAQSGTSTSKRSRLRDAILETLRSVGHRLTGSQLLSAMERLGHEFSERRLFGELAKLARLKILTKNPDADPPGYGLPEWK